MYGKQNLTLHAHHVTYHYYQVITHFLKFIPTPFPLYFGANFIPEFA